MAKSATRYLPRLANPSGQRIGRWPISCAAPGSNALNQPDLNQDLKIAQAGSVGYTGSSHVVLGAHGTGCDDPLVEGLDARGQGGKHGFASRRSEEHTSELPVTQ